MSTRELIELCIAEEIDLELETVHGGVNEYDYKPRAMGRWLGTQRGRTFEWTDATGSSKWEIRQEEGRQSDGMRWSLVRV